jgi:hypothetical protein
VWRASVNNHYHYAYVEVGNIKMLTKDGETVVEIPLYDNEVMYVPIPEENAWMMRSKKYKKYIIMRGNEYSFLVLDNETDAVDYFAEAMLKFCDIHTRGKMLKLFKDAYAIYKQIAGQQNDYETFREEMLSTYL